MQRSTDRHGMPGDQVALVVMEEPAYNGDKQLLIRIVASLTGDVSCVDLGFQLKMPTCQCPVRTNAELNRALPVYAGEKLGDFLLGHPVGSDGIRGREGKHRACPDGKVGFRLAGRPLQIAVLVSCPQKVR